MPVGYFRRGSKALERKQYFLPAVGYEIEIVAICADLVGMM